MHNCKATRSSFVELALDDLSPAESARVLAELKDCRECREELATTRSALRTSGQALQAALPGEEFWAGYHARLRTAIGEVNVSGVEAGQTGRAPQRIEQHPPGTPPCLRSQPTTRAQAWLTLQRLMKTSVRVPAPVAAMLLLLFGATVFFAMQSRATTKESLTPTPAELVTGPTRIVEVPVYKEKLVTRVVYVETNRRLRNAVNDSNVGRDDNDNGSGPTIDMTSGVARVHSFPRPAELSLAGFKPADEVKLTIIKGSDPK